MHQRNLFESEQVEGKDSQLEALTKELNDAVEKAKALAHSCKVRHYQDNQYRTDTTGELILPEYKDDVNYNEEFWKKYLKNQINFAIIKELTEKIAELEKQMLDIDNLHQQYQKLYKIKNRKKNRRTAQQIEKKFDCPYDNCYRIYGSDVSLNLHIKLKHNGGNKTDREHLAEQICLAELKGLQMPEMRFNLPKGFLQEYREKFREKEQNSGSLWIETRNKQLFKLGSIHSTT